MTVVSSLKVKVVRKTALKLKVLPKFPSSVTATSPLALSTTGGNYQFSLDVAALETSLAASATIDATNASNITSGTLPAARLPNPTATTLGGVESIAPVSHNWINSISTSGVPSLSQPAFTDISGSVAATQLPNPSASTLGGVQSAAAVSHQWINSISTSGVPALSQPAFTDISGNIAVSQMNSGTGAAATTLWRGDGTWANIGALFSVGVAGASTTYTTAQVNFNVQRSNSGAAMIDTLPGTSPGILSPNSVITITNADASALLAISAGTGATIKGGTNGFLYLGPGQTLTVQSDGTNYWPISLPVRAKLGAATTIFVATTGNDSTAHGLTSGSPFLTGTHAWLFAQSVLDLNGFVLTIQVADGTYTTPIILRGPLVGQAGQFAQGNTYGAVLQGNLVTPANALISVTGNPYGAIFMYGDADVLIQGFKVTSITSGNGIYVENSRMAFKTMEFGACVVNHVTASRNSYVQVVGAYTISGGAGCNLLQSNSWISFESTATITLIGTPAFASGFVGSQYAGSIVCDLIPVFSGSATGPRYTAFLNGIINTGGQGANFFPGNAAGTTATGGQYA